MKKIISLLIILTIVASLFVACKDDTPTEKDYTLSMGVAVAPSLGSAKVTSTVATIVTDADGKIVLCKFDCVDYSAKYSDAGVLDTTAPTSKVTMGDAYAMPAGSWATQGEALANYVKGKTQAEVAATALTNGYASDADLKASCSINIVDMLKAVDNAFASQHKVAFKATAETFAAGLASAGSVKDTAKDGVKNAKYSVTFAASILAEGKVVATILDTVEPELCGITEEGAASLTYAGTKREQGDAYSMPSGAWYEQADAYAKEAVGKTADDIATLATEGVAGCSIYVGEYKQAIEAAVKAAK